MGAVYSERELACVFFIDHGEWAEVPLRRLFRLPDFVAAFPLQALPCIVPGGYRKDKEEGRMLLYGLLHLM